VKLMIATTALVLVSMAMLIVAHLVVRPATESNLANVPLAVAPDENTHAAALPSAQKEKSSPAHIKRTRARQ
jgi:hypothetical protein